jgi:hypothetical protein
MKSFKYLFLVFLIFSITACSLSEQEQKNIKTLQSNINILINNINKEISIIDKNSLKNIDKKDLIFNYKKQLIIMKNSLNKRNNYLKDILLKNDDSLYNKYKNIKSDYFIFFRKFNILKKDIEKRINLFNKIRNDKKSLRLFFKYFSKNLNNSEQLLLTKISKTIKDFPNREKDIKFRTNNIFLKIKKVKNKLLKLNNQNIEDSEFLKIYDFLFKSKGTLIDFINLKIIELEQLYHTEIKILKDTKRESFLSLILYSWDSYSDFNTDKEDIIPKFKVSTKIADYIDKNNVDFIESVPGVWSSYSCKTEEFICKEISKKLNWESYAKRHGNNAGELWVNSVINNYYFKYIKIIDTNKIETKWIPVSENDFYFYKNSKGKTIYSKPYGYFLDEAIYDPTEIGKTLVGNSHYGEWKKDPNTGESFWSFYGKYMFISNLMDLFFNSHSSNRSYNNHRYTKTNYNKWKNNYSYNTKKRKHTYTSANTSNYSGRKYSYSNSRSKNSSFRGRGPSGGGK